MSSQAALERADASVNTACQREAAAIDPPLFHVQAPRYATPEAAQTALAPRATSWRAPQGETAPLIEHTHSARQGKPPPTPITAMDWHLHAQGCPEHQHIEERKPQGACVVLGSNLAAPPLSDLEVRAAYHAHAHAEGGFRLLQAPMGFVASLLVKKPCRRQGVLRVMTGARGVDAVTQRRWRQQWTRQNETLPNQINPPTERPTWRWLFPLLEGMPRVRMTMQGQLHDRIGGLNDVPIPILRLFGKAVCRLYQISSA